MAEKSFRTGHILSQGMIGFNEKTTVIQLELQDYNRFEWIIPYFCNNPSFSLSRTMPQKDCPASSIHHTLPFGIRSVCLRYPDRMGLFTGMNHLLQASAIYRLQQLSLRFISSISLRVVFLVQPRPSTRLRGISANSQSNFSSAGFPKCCIRQ